MGVAASRRGFEGLVAIAIGLLPALVQPITAGAVTSTGTLFGVTGQSWTTLSRIDPGTGTITPIAQLAGPDNDQITSLTGDPATHRIFAIHTTVTPGPKITVTTSFIVTINSLTGAFTSSPPPSVFVGSIKYDTSSNILYGITYSPTGQSLVRLDPSTGAATTVASFPSIDPVSMSMEVASGTNTVYINREPRPNVLPPPPPTSQVLTVNTLTGAVTTSPVLNRTTVSITYDTAANKLYGATECCPRDLVQIDPVSGAEQVIGNIHATGQQIFGKMATDSATHTVLADVQFQGTGFTWEDHIVSIDTVTRLATVGPAIPAGNIGALYFEGATPLLATTGTLFGIAGHQEALAKIDLGTGTVTRIAQLAGPDNGQVGSLTGDPATHRIFGIRTSVSGVPPAIAMKNEILTINSQTGTFTVSPPVNAPISEAKFDTSSNTLYALTYKSLVRVDPTTGAFTTVALFSNPTSGILSMEVAPGTNKIYISNMTMSFSMPPSPPSPPTTQILTVNTLNGTVSTSPVLSRAIRSTAYDTSTNKLFGATECCPRDLLQVDPVSGTETFVSSINNSNGQIFGFHMATDSASHTVFGLVATPITWLTAENHIVSINNQTGTSTISPTLSEGVGAMYFETAGTPPDTSPPTTSIALSPAPNGAGWNNTDVSVNLSATDPDGVADVATVQYSAAGAQTIAPTVVAGSTASFTLTAEGVTTVTYFAKDKAGNTEAAHTQVVRIDKTPPTVTYTGNATTYTIDQTVSITCTAVDPPNANGTAGSGLALSTCVNVSGPAYSFPLGSNTFSASATDVAGNTGSGSTTFTVQVTFAGLCNLTVQFIQSSAAFQTLPEPAQAQADRLCRLLERADLASDPEKKAKLIEHYQKALPLLVKFTFLTADQSAILLTLSQAL
jgi:hypothetical protein